ncbi:EAL domain-containing response regulator [Oharaeibacter diazotrophicus]|uniref:PAS domain S-box-containing protein/diguanylate cyclase (GGDEF)-like protein n=1 Tax=Oharaeibacter diazotrophicus TaxID=1920512 RepID=A0A4R6RAT9_9HYPH|nr:EAL domain-containing protein [Oharaeibacter diazotrophicus]TDP82746.1 PAS domain S-box-containing protein/diguanylate cyclase (GGDEF)-like protein [Oharaeibacter diazotrophicus]BBE72492.1 cyclic di-GMP phosphodiesterase Gmr [Pleomorphomonas sp. SM30]GLS76523.1 two-component system response regulator [Oharaeibacter diazotrophicus]
MPTVVIVDDQITNQKIFSRMAEAIEDGLDVVTFGDPAAALDWLNQNVPDLIVTDYQMPAMNGAAFIRRIRADRRLADVPVVVITVFEERSFRLNALDAGATDFLQSPVDHREFVTRARNLLKLRRQQLELAGRADTLERRLVRSEKTLERAIRDSSERLAQVIDAVPTLICATDVKGRILFANAYLARFLGLDPASMVRRPMREVLGEETGSAAEALDAAVIEKGEAIGNIEWELSDPSGGRHWFVVAKTPLRDAFDRTIGVVTTALDITDRKATETHLHYIAHNDALTGLPNRTALIARLRMEVARGRRGERSFALHLIDLDDFKAVNDAHGHAVGDRLLVRAAERMRHLVDDGAFVSRLGGDEFAVVQANVGCTEEVAEMATRICRLFDEPFTLTPGPVQTSASVGTAIHPTDGTDPEELFRYADLAMYRAKESGGAQFRFYAADMKLRAQQTATLDAELRHAVENDEFELHYQPQVDAESHRVVGVEALIRWRLADGSLRGPGAFLQRAEAIGLMLPINTAVLEKACRQQAAWRDAGLPLRVSVNLSPVQFRGGALPLQVARILAETGADAGLLDLELTETTMMEDLAVVADQLAEIRALGVSISIDDFGTGFSSLSYVKRFPADRLKIDQSFVRDVLKNPADAAIVRTVVTLGASFGMTVVAEGVETARQAVFLAEAGCAELQGYHFGRPMPADDIERLVAARAQRQRAGGKR